MKTFKEWLKEGLFYTDGMGPKPDQAPMATAPMMPPKMMKKNMKKKMKKK